MDEKILSISDLQIDYFNLDKSVRNNERSIFSQSRCSHCGGSHRYKKPQFNPRNSNNNHNERNGRKPNTCFRCVSEDHFILNCKKPETSDKKVHWNIENPKTCVYRLNKIDKTF